MVFENIVFGKVFEFVVFFIDYMYEENNYVDFNWECFFYYGYSIEGFWVGQGDLNGDGYMDIVIFGFKGVFCVVYFGQVDGSFFKIVLE